jgi:hypothetical protein
MAYKNRSVAEPNCADVASKLFMDSGFKPLRNCIYPNDEERRRFRQLVVNAVMATDIVDKELQPPRRSRWDATFSKENSLQLDERVSPNAMLGLRWSASLKHPT